MQVVNLRLTTYLAIQALRALRAIVHIYRARKQTYCCVIKVNTKLGYGLRTATLAAFLLFLL